MSSEYIGKPCPKCSHVRAASESAPDWQCPKCGIAYMKFVESQSAPVAYRPVGGAAAADLDLTGHQALQVTQKFELAEVFDFETRNRYRISDATGRPVGYAAEERKGLLGFVFRQLLGHWRHFEIHFYDNQRREVLHAVHPFRIYFSRLEVFNANQQRIGAIQKRFSILTKRFCVENARGVPVMEVASPIWKLWTFPFVAKGREVAFVKKKWSGLLSEGLTDRDDFRVEFDSATLDNDTRNVILAAAIYVDLAYFERKG